MLPVLHVTPLDYYKMTEQLLHFERDAPLTLRHHLLRGMERCLECLLWADDSPLLELWRRGAADASASCLHSGASRAIGGGGEGSQGLEEGSPRKRQRVPSASSNYSRTCCTSVVDKHFLNFFARRLCAHAVSAYL